MTWLDADTFTGEVGKTYEVSWRDCCTEGYFVSKLTEVVRSADGPYIDRLMFEHGEVIDGLVQLTEVAVSA